MKVTTQGEDVINHLWDVIAAKGFESDMYFEMAARDIRALPKLEGTVHVNIALIVKFMPNYFFNHVDLPEIPRRDDPANDQFLFQQGETRGLGEICFPDYRSVFSKWNLENVAVFQGQCEVFQQMLEQAPPGDAQRNDIDFLLAVGEIFTLIVYAQLVLENSKIDQLDADVVDGIFDVFVRDFSRFAVNLYGKATSTQEQSRYCLEMIQKPKSNDSRDEKIWKETISPLQDAYTMNP